MLKTTLEKIRKDMPAGMRRFTGIVLVISGFSLLLSGIGALRF